MVGVNTEIFRLLLILIFTRTEIDLDDRVWLEFE